MDAGRVLCDDVLRRRMRTCVLSVSSMVGWSVSLSIPALRLGTLVPRQKGLKDHYQGNSKPSMKEPIRGVDWFKLSQLCAISVTVACGFI